MAIEIEAALERDVERLQEIEVVSGAQFADIGMPEIAADEPPSLDFYRENVAARLISVALDVGEVQGASSERHVAGYILFEPIDAGLHIEQVSVDPQHAGLGIGAALIDTVVVEAQDRGLKQVTLTTFLDVPWNAPYYARLGFEVIGPAKLSIDLQKIRDAEINRGLDQWARVCMRKRL